MSYLDRLQKSIVLTSPSGQEFTASWVGDTVSNSKRLGVFNTPGVNGTQTQDLGIEGNSYPLKFWFTGADNDIIAATCYEALGEKGKWNIVHPVLGTKILQLISYSKQVQPVTSGNVTEFNTDWLETIEEEGVKSSAQLESMTIAQNVVLEDTAQTQLNDVVDLDTADQSGKFKNAVEHVVSAYNVTLDFTTRLVAEVQAQADSIKRGIDIALTEVPYDVLSIAGQIQALVNLPTLVVTDVNSKIDTYVRFYNAIFEIEPDAPTLANINTAAVMETALTSALGAVAITSVTGTLNSRQCVIDTIESNISFFEDVTNSLDNIQELYKDELLKNAYFSQSQSFNDAGLLFGLALAFLIRSAFDLAIEKKIVLTQEENPVLFAAEQYGGFGDNDLNITLFFESNELTGQECLLMPVGKVVVVYV